MTTKHTPGPWSRNIKPAAHYPIVFAGRNTHVAQVCSAGLTTEENEANCDLIAAAPDLLAALHAALIYLGDDSTDDSPEARATRSDIRAAIAKAEGQ